MSSKYNCDECAKVPKPLPPNISSKMKCAQYIKSFGSFVPYNRSKTGNLIGGRGRANAAFPAESLVKRNKCGKIIN